MRSFPRHPAATQSARPDPAIDFLARQPLRAAHPQILEAYGAGSTTFFDIGSNYGFFSYWMLHRLPKIQVHSFEPNPATFELVRRAKESNRLDRLHPHHLGLADQAGSLELHPGHDDSGHSTFTNHPLLHSPAIANVPVMAFDDWRMTAGLPQPSPGDWVAKIDVEGFELKVLHGMRLALADRAFRLIAIEFNDYTLALADTKPEHVLAFFEDAGYVPLETVPSGNRWDVNKSGNRFFVPKPLPPR